MRHTFEQALPVAIRVHRVSQAQPVGDLLFSNGHWNGSDCRRQKIKDVKRIFDQVLEEALEMAGQQDERAAQEGRILARRRAPSVGFHFRRTAKPEQGPNLAKSLRQLNAPVRSAKI